MDRPFWSTADNCSKFIDDTITIFSSTVALPPTRIAKLPNLYEASLFKSYCRRVLHGKFDFDPSTWGSERCTAPALQSATASCCTHQHDIWCRRTGFTSVPDFNLVWSRCEAVKYRKFWNARHFQMFNLVDLSQRLRPITQAIYPVHIRHSYDSNSSFDLLIYYGRPM